MIMVPGRSGLNRCVTGLSLNRGIVFYLPGAADALITRPGRKRGGDERTRRMMMGIHRMPVGTCCWDGETRHDSRPAWNTGVYRRAHGKPVVQLAKIYPTVRAAAREHGNYPGGQQFGDEIGA